MPVPQSARPETPQRSDEHWPSADDAPQGPPAAGARLAAPPRDVRALLERHGASLPRYLDVERWQLLEQGARRWPLLFRAQPTLEDVA